MTEFFQRPQGRTDLPIDAQLASAAAFGHRDRIFVDIQAPKSLHRLHEVALGFGHVASPPNHRGQALLQVNPRSPRPSTPLFLQLLNRSFDGLDKRRTLKMTPDEKEIRELIATWMAATKASDTPKVLSLMTEDVVFLVPGQPPMRKADFLKAAAAQVGNEAPTFDGTSEVQEITVVGDWAFMWTKLRVIVTTPTGVAPMIRAGHTLSVLRKQDGKWLLARDANLLATE